jgi:hypothetical protein
MLHLLSGGILAGAAAALTLGAIQLPAARNVFDALQSRLIGSAVVGSATSVAVNRAAKADRAFRPASPGMTRTVSLRLSTLADTSILVRIPAALNLPKSPVTPRINSGTAKPAVACEAVVSVLTDIAGQLQPGRCLT